MSVAQQVIAVFSGVKGYLDNVEIGKVGEYEKELMEFLAANNQTILDSISSSGKLDESNEDELKKALDSFSNTFNN